jgi:acetyl esterase/lipase
VSDAPASAPKLSSRHLVGAELRPALGAMPSFTVTADTLSEIRCAIADAQVPAPPAPATTVAERFVPRADGTSLRLLLYAPEAGARTGGLLWLHGGGMVMARPDGNEALCRYLAGTAGCVVAAVDYRLAPEHPYPAGLEDCYVALRWMDEGADELGFRRDRLAVAGESGGGGLAAGLSLLARDRVGVVPSAQFLLYPMLDDRTGTELELDALPYAGEFVWTRESNRFAWSAVLGDAFGSADVPIYAAPARADDLTGVPPTSIFVGDLDLFAGEDLQIARTLVRSGVPTELNLYPGAYHGFITFAQDAPVSKRAFQAFSNAITRHFGEQARAERPIEIAGRRYHWFLSAASR